MPKKEKWLEFMERWTSKSWICISSRLLMFVFLVMNGAASRCCIGHNLLVGIFVMNVRTIHSQYVRWSWLIEGLIRILQILGIFEIVQNLPNNLKTVLWLPLQVHRCDICAWSWCFPGSNDLWRFSIIFCAMNLMNPKFLAFPAYANWTSYNLCH